jgi:Ribbon-helix-helix protein, copG family
MRTTINLDSDVAAAVQQLRRKEGIGMSEALNRIARAGLVGTEQRGRFRQRTKDMGDFLVDVSNVAEALELIEGPTHR